MASAIGNRAVADLDLGADCVEHARMFFNRPAFDLASARPPTFALVPRNKTMLEGLQRDYQAMQAMIFGEPPSFDAILESVVGVEEAINREISSA